MHIHMHEEYLEHVYVSSQMFYINVCYLNNNINTHARTHVRTCVRTYVRTHTHKRTYVRTHARTHSAWVSLTLAAYLCIIVGVSRQMCLVYENDGIFYLSIFQFHDTPDMPAFNNCAQITV